MERWAAEKRHDRPRKMVRRHQAPQSDPASAVYDYEIPEWLKSD